MFVVSTVNGVSQVPPELLRRECFDEIFFLDLLSSEEHRTIYTVHLRKIMRQVESFNRDRLVGLSEGYVGAEIGQAIVEAMYRAFSDEKSPPSRVHDSRCGSRAARPCPRELLPA